MEIESLVHVMLVSFPGQGHVNPLLRLGKLIASKGLIVTFVTTEFWGNRFRNSNKIEDGVLRPVGKGFIRFEFFDDGCVDLEKREEFTFFNSQLELTGKREIKRLVKRYEEDKQRVSCLINNPFISWVSDVAEELQIPNAVLWVQSCACFSAYYHYHHRSVPFPSETEPEIDVQLPCMPLLKHDEVPSFLHPSTYSPLGDAILGQYKKLNKPFCILMDTFDALESEIVGYMSKLCPIKTVGPLFKISKTVSSDVSADMYKPSDICLEWLDTQNPSSVVYISFGSVVHLKQEQIDELAHGILKAGVSFLWVVRPPQEELNLKPHVLPQELIEERDKGKIVEWCPQEKVLAHPAIACFVTHCGWNSTMEALTLGVPVLCFPQWGDQVTNASYLVNVFKTGLRLSRGKADERLVLREEVEKRLLEATVGQKAVEMKKNAMKWKAESEAAAAYGGSSIKNFQEFVDQLSIKPITKDIQNHVLS